MAKLKKKFIKMRVEEESVLSAEELEQKLETIIDTQYRKNLNKLRGASVCLWSHAGEDQYKLKYYHSYRDDMCDTMMTIGIEKGMERSSVHGFIHKPAGIWACFWGVIASLLIDFIVISYCILFVANFDLINGLMFSAAVSVVRAFVCVSLIEIKRDKVKILRTELLSVLRDKPPQEILREEYPDEPEYPGTEADEYEVIDESEVQSEDEGD